MHGFWRGIIAGSIIGATMSMYMQSEKKNKGMMGFRSKRKGSRMIKGVSKTVKELMR